MSSALEALILLSEWMRASTCEEKRASSQLSMETPITGKSKSTNETEKQRFTISAARTGFTDANWI